jgi:hypothetical protein
MPSGRTFLANHDATRASALGSPFNSTGGFEPCFRIDVTINLPTNPPGEGSLSRFAAPIFDDNMPTELATNEPNLQQQRPNQDPGQHGAALRAMRQPWA